jgi:NADP-dependent 3-hydroxy acid dehydrogenase YdfG
VAERFAGQVVLITGASAGIGVALARRFAAEGASLVLLARRLERLQALGEELRAQGAQVLVCQADVCDAAAIESAVAQTLATFGRLDVAVANAGFGVAGFFETLTLDDYQRQFDTNVYGVLRTARACFDALKATRGRFAIMGSVAGHVAAPGSSPYAMSKYAIRAFAESLRGEWYPSGVSVTLISPGFVDSEIRRIDNAGSLRDHAQDPVPAWLRVSAARAVRPMVAAIARRRREVVVTFHGKALVAISRWAPWLFAWLGTRGVRGRKEPK